MVGCRCVIDAECVSRPIRHDGLACKLDLSASFHLHFEYNIIRGVLGIFQNHRHPILESLSAIGGPENNLSISKIKFANELVLSCGEYLDPTLQPSLKAREFREDLARLASSQSSQRWIRQILVLDFFRPMSTMAMIMLSCRRRRRRRRTMGTNNHFARKSPFS